MAAMCTTCTTKENKDRAFVVNFSLAGRYISFSIIHVFAAKIT